MKWLPAGARRPGRRGRRWPALAAVSAGLALMLACGGDRRPPNVVVIVIDTLRADHLGCYGYGRPTSPHIDRLADTGTLFEQASSVSSHTRPATASLFTGLYPTVHGAVGHRGSVSPDVRTLAELLAEAGYRTVAFHRNGNISDTFGFGRGFERYEGVEKGFWRELRRQTPKDVPLRIGQADDSLLARRALDFLGQTPAAPFFLYLHLADPHDPYTPPRDSPLFPAGPLTPTAELFYQQPVRSATRERPVLDRLKLGLLPLDETTRRQMIALYDAEIAAADVQVGRILEGLAELGLSEETVVFLTADHGEEFWDHGDLGHGQSHYQELLHVPFIAAGPGIARQRISRPVSLIDLMPTVLELAGLPADGLPGHSLLPALTGKRQPAAVPIYSESLMRMDFHGDPMLFRSLRAGDLKLVLDFRRERKLLFDLAADPGEQRNLGSDEPGRRRLLATLIEAHQANLSAGRRITAMATDIPEDLEARLRALGYVGGETETEDSASSFMRRPLRLIDADALGFLGHETDGASYLSMLDFSSPDLPEEQLLYGFGVFYGAPSRRFSIRAGVRLRREPEHTRWRLSGVTQGAQGEGVLSIAVRVDGGEPQTRPLELGRRFTIEGDLPPDSGRFLRLDFACDRAHFVARGERSDGAGPCLSVERLGLSE